MRSVVNPPAVQAGPSEITAGKRMSWRVALTFLAATLIAMTATSITYADGGSPTIVRMTQCADDGGASVPADTPISLILPGYAQGTYGLIRSFLLDEQTTLTIVRNGITSTVDLTGTYAAPQQLDTHLWVTRPPNYDLGTLAAGDSIQVTDTITFKHPLLVAYPPVTSSGDNGPFLTRGEDPISCTITATSDT